MQATWHCGEAERVPVGVESWALAMPLSLTSVTLNKLANVFEVSISHW